MIARQIAAPYALERVAGHGDRLRRALAQPGQVDSRTLRNLAPYAITP
jgi:hypothetical protein